MLFWRGFFLFNGMLQVSKTSEKRKNICLVKLTAIVSSRGIKYRGISGECQNKSN